MNKTFENLIDISIKQFAENGYYGTSLKEISDELGVKKPSLYNYIGSKEELYKICIDSCKEANNRIIESMNLENLSIRVALYYFIECYLNEHNHLLRFHIQLSFAPKNIDYKVKEYNEHLMDNLTRKLERLYEIHNLKVKKEEFLLVLLIFISNELFKHIFSFQEDNIQINKDEYNKRCYLIMNEIIK
ncbi:TetR/AcrR family transcriptional regulator [Mammaliicoccus sciuri]|uniref:TetR/AcrR family transcriptional regulator n=1 Tax=Mammaliicoccus sciuri TaxID=1296 RepID=UPI00208F4DE6|nr:TetR/AcrR family transcriptional regulator [Mammaliicoccus sciuri]